MMKTPKEEWELLHDALMQRNEDNHIKDQLLREGQQEPEESLGIRNQTFSLLYPFKSRDEISCSGGHL